jgi:oligoendopeptidase F
MLEIKTPRADEWMHEILNQMALIGDSMPLLESEDKEMRKRTIERMRSAYKNLRRMIEQVYREKQTKELEEQKL